MHSEKWCLFTPIKIVIDPRFLIYFANLTKHPLPLFYPESHQESCADHVMLLKPRYHKILSYGIKNDDLPPVRYRDIFPKGWAQPLDEVFKDEGSNKPLYDVMLDDKPVVLDILSEEQALEIVDSMDEGYSVSLKQKADLSPDSVTTD